MADEADDEVCFHTTYSHGMGSPSLSSSLDNPVRSLPEDGIDPFDFSVYMDQARNEVFVAADS